MDGRRLPSSLLFNALTSPREAITSARWRRRYANFHQLRYTTMPGKPSGSNPQQGGESNRLNL